jgi:hypothetical protein
MVPRYLAISTIGLCYQTIDSACTGIYTYVSGADVSWYLSISWVGLQTTIVLTVVAKEGSSHFSCSLAFDVFPHVAHIVFV